MKSLQSFIVMKDSWFINRIHIKKKSNKCEITEWYSYRARFFSSNNSWANSDEDNFIISDWQFLKMEKLNKLKCCNCRYWNEIIYMP